MYKLKIYYNDSQVVRKYAFYSIFSLYRFMYNQLKNKPRVKELKVVKIDV